MREFARLVLSISAVILVACAAVMAVLWVMAIGDRRPDVPASVWFMSALGCMVTAGLCAWCVSMIEYGSYIADLHRMIEKDLHERQKS